MREMVRRLSRHGGAAVDDGEGDHYLAMLPFPHRPLGCSPGAVAASSGGSRSTRRASLASSTLTHWVPPALGLLSPGQLDSGGNGNYQSPAAGYAEFVAGAART